MATRAQERINRNVNELSAKLLEGCKLLSESCPETNVPLVLTKDGRMFSVGNNQYYKRDGGKLSVDHEAPQPQQMPSQAVPMHGGGYAPYEPAQAHYASTPAAQRTAHTPGVAAFYGAPPAEKPAEASSSNLPQRVAAKLLEGWQLLAESCPQTNVPLVHSRDGQILSVGTGKYYVREATGALRELPSSGGPLHANGAPSPYPASVQPYAVPHARAALCSHSPPSRLGSQAGAAAVAMADAPALPSLSAAPSLLSSPYAPAATYQPPRTAASYGAAASLAQTHSGGLDSDALRVGKAPAHHAQTLSTTLVRAPCSPARPSTSHASPGLSPTTVPHLLRTPPTCALGLSGFSVCQATRFTSGARKDGRPRDVKAAHRIHPGDCERHRRGAGAAQLIVRLL